MYGLFKLKVVPNAMQFSYDTGNFQVLVVGLVVLNAFFFFLLGFGVVFFFFGFFFHFFCHGQVSGHS